MLVVGPSPGRSTIASARAVPARRAASTAAAFVLLLSPTAKPRRLRGLGCSGLGIGLAFASLANLIVQAVPQEQTGVATGMNTVMRTLGGALGARSPRPS